MYPADLTTWVVRLERLAESELNEVEYPWQLNQRGHQYRISRTPILQYIYENGLFCMNSIYILTYV